MDNAQKAIMIGVGLFITIIIISAVLLIVNLGTGLVDDATAELDSMSTSMQKDITAAYDNKTISGSQVLSAIKKYEDDTSICVVLCNQTGNIVARTGAMAITAIVGVPGNVAEVTADNANMVEFTAEYTFNPATRPAVGQTEKVPLSVFSNIKAPSGVYVNTSRMYNAVLIRDAENDVILGIAFRPVDV